MDNFWRQRADCGNKSATCFNCLFQNTIISLFVCPLWLKIMSLSLHFCPFNNLKNYISTALYCTVCGIIMYVTGFSLTNISLIEFSLNSIWIVYEAAPGRHFNSLSFECIVSIKLPSLMGGDELSLDVFRGLFGLSLSSLNAFGCYL